MLGLFLLCRIMVDDLLDLAAVDVEVLGYRSLACRRSRVDAHVIRLWQ
jgi:hypothetical protein